MKKAFLFLFLTAFVLSFSACGSDDDDDQQRVVFTVEYESESRSFITDKGARIHIFDFSDYDSNNYTFDMNDERFYNNETGSSYPPTKTFTVGQQTHFGYEIAPKKDYTIVAVSSHYPEKYIIKTFNSTEIIEYGTEIILQISKD